MEERHGEGGPDERFMREALREALFAFQEGEVPVGAVVVRRGKVIASARNQCETSVDPTAHAEMLALRQAAASIGSYRLLGAELFVTVEPCVMCAGALQLSRVGRVVYGCSDPKGGALGSLYEVHQDERLNHRFQVVAGVLEDECRELMQMFFRQRRGRKLPEPDG